MKRASQSTVVQTFNTSRWIVAAPLTTRVTVFTSFSGVQKAGFVFPFLQSVLSLPEAV
jgi:hypothetical protein